MPGKTPLLAACLLAALAGCALDVDLASLEQPIVNGLSDAGKDPAVGYFKLFSANHTYLGHCTGTFITDRIALTAAHCASGGEGDASYELWFIDSLDEQSNQITGALDTNPRKSVKVWVDPAFVFDRFDVGHDIALVLFDGPPPAGVKPLPITRTRNDTRLLRKSDRFVGYGRKAADSRSPLFDRQVGTAFIDNVSAQHFNWTGGVTYVCNGDSGGPHFIPNLFGLEEIVGVTSGGLPGCIVDSLIQRLDVSVLPMLQFIAENDPQPTANCGADGVCGWNCPGLDPDCPCVADGKCTAGCTDPDSDPDCPPFCGADGVCTRTGCPIPDPDCGNKATGDACTNKNECLGGLCITPTGQTANVCSQSCAGASGCPSAFSCDTIVHQCQPMAKAAAGGCAVAGAEGGGGLGALLVLLLVTGARAVAPSAARSRPRRPPGLTSSAAACRPSCPPSCPP